MSQSPRNYYTWYKYHGTNGPFEMEADTTVNEN